MSKFLTGEKLSEEVYNIIWDAESTLLIVSPYIKLGKYFKELFDHHLHNHKLHLILVFGKNEKDVKKSMSQVDLDYFQQFPNISIVYVPNLHAKYYGNEKKGVITSINLYDYSFKNNIEFGVFTEQSILNKFSSSADNEAWNTCMEIVENHEVIFIRRPVYKIKKGILGTSKDYKKSETLLNATDDFYVVKRSHSDSGKRLEDFDDELELDSDQMVRPERDLEEEIIKKTKKTSSKNTFENSRTVTKTQTGYCIRTGEEIDFNPEKPLSNKAFKMWSKYGDLDYQEKYCHYSGEPSSGGTTFAKPILRKNWKKAMSN
ncbi:hypothetical protein BC962_2053 [Gillisia mitskevichiae]|uniref:Phospholipase D-like protein n=1 Tax=Gillisia mitskevichiae TaxID=270921 RepID=A0A495PUX4_9FLAO|nr:hypothetical protein [Gillisia mitskevichiae]RKS53796.1 hypothetical protein BC962_2053 [Gillisia mitskevichiae]